MAYHSNFFLIQIYWCEIYCYQNAQSRTVEIYFVIAWTIMFHMFKRSSLVKYV